MTDLNYLSALHQKLLQILIKKDEESDDDNDEKDIDVANKKKYSQLDMIQESMKSYTYFDFEHLLPISETTWPEILLQVLRKALKSS